MPPRAAKHLGALFIDVTGEAHAVPLPGHVHAGPVGPVLSVMGMCQRRTLPRAEFFMHRSLLLADHEKLMRARHWARRQRLHAPRVPAPRPGVASRRAGLRPAYATPA